MRLMLNALVAVVLLSPLPTASAAVIWTFNNAASDASSVQGQLVVRAPTPDAGATWALSDIDAFSFSYDGQLFDVLNVPPGDSLLLLDEHAGLPILQFTANSPFLPFVETSIGDLRSQLLGWLQPRQSGKVLTIVGSTDGRTFLSCSPYIIAPAQPVCGGATRDLVTLEWTRRDVAEPSILVILCTSSSFLAYRWRAQSRRERRSTRRE